MTETLYLKIVPGRWRKPRIARVTKKPMRLTPGLAAALVKLEITLPDAVLIPRVPVARVEIRPEHIAAPQVTATVSP